VQRAKHYNIKKTNTSAERWSSQTKPILGGVTFFIIFLFSLLNYSILFNSNALFSSEIFGVLIVITISFMMGFADDILNTPPGFKFTFQLLNGIILIYSGIYINIFEYDWANYFLTIFWVIAIMNSVNMLDNMDAITTSVSIAILTGAICILYVLMPFSGVFLIISIGALASLLSFLVYNWHPSKMYMGDNGSQFLGAILAVISIQIFWNTPILMGIDNKYSLLIILMAFIIPISDTATVTINRLLRKQSPFIGGKDHTTHHLSYIGLSEKTIARTLTSINLLFVIIVAFIILYPEKNELKILIFGSLALLVFAILYTITKISKQKK
jgi:UDP-GlcNAc:undecaprenyl-phosphate GlcNAc-1-phosphate transferase